LRPAISVPVAGRGGLAERRARARWIRWRRAERSRSLLETRWRSPELDKVIRVSLYCVLATLGLATVMPYHIAMEWCVLVTILLCVVMIVVSYLSWRHYNPAARAYFYAWTVALSGFVVYALTVMGYLPLNIVTAHASQIGLAGQIILFSFALADRIKLVQGEALSWSQRALANLRQYQSLFDNAVEGVFQMSLDRRFITANPAMAEIIVSDIALEISGADPA